MKLVPIANAASILSLVAAGVGLAGVAAAQPPGVQPDGPGCYGRVLLPGHEDIVSQRVLQSPAREERHVIAAVVERTVRHILVHPAQIERKTVPALYRTEVHTYQVPGARRWVQTQAQYTTVTERVLVSPGRWIWERHYGPMASAPAQPGQTLVEPTGEIMCKVWCPAKYADVQRQVLAAPGRRFAVQTSITRKTVRRVLVHPAEVLERTVPALYRDETVSRIVRRERVEVRRIGPVYGAVQSRRLVPGGEGWARVVCGGPLSMWAMQRMQASLAQRGYDPGPVDGQGRPQTYEALRRFQMDNHMAAGQITVESARALGVIQ
jgi:hypothetical protein